MTVANKLLQALTSAKGLSSDLKTFSLDTEDEQAKQLFDQMSQTAENMAQELQGRLDFLQSEEPQYRQE